MDDNTIKFTVPADNSEEMKQTLTEVYRSLTEKGYNPINQIVGYLLSEDPTYITNTTTLAASSASSTETSFCRSWSDTICSIDPSEDRSADSGGRKPLAVVLFPFCNFFERNFLKTRFILSQNNIHFSPQSTRYGPFCSRKAELITRYSKKQKSVDNSISMCYNLVTIYWRYICPKRMKF